MAEILSYSSGSVMTIVIFSVTPIDSEPVFPSATGGNVVTVVATLDGGAVSVADAACVVVDTGVPTVDGGDVGVLADSAQAASNTTAITVIARRVRLIG